jgi:hypothetical protein
MSVFVLLGGIDHEGHVLLGVFSSRELAESHRDSYDAGASALGRYDWYDIVERAVDSEVDPFLDF